MTIFTRFTAVLFAAAAAHAATTCEIEARAWRMEAKPPQRVALDGCIARQTGAAAATGRLAFGVSSLEAQRFEEALPFLQKAKPNLTPIDDYLDFFLATAFAGLERYPAALAALEPVWRQRTASPIAGRAALLAAKSYLATGKPAEAVGILEQNEAALAQAAGDAPLAEATAAAGPTVKARAYFSPGYCRYPQPAGG